MATPEKRTSSPARLGARLRLGSFPAAAGSGARAPRSLSSGAAEPSGDIIQTAASPPATTGQSPLPFAQMHPRPDSAQTRPPQALPPAAMRGAGPASRKVAMHPSTPGQAPTARAPPRLVPEKQKGLPKPGPEPADHRKDVTRKRKVPGNLPTSPGASPTPAIRPPANAGLHRALSHLGTQDVGARAACPRSSSQSLTSDQGLSHRPGPPAAHAPGQGTRVTACREQEWPQVGTSSMTVPAFLRLCFPWTGGRPCLLERAGEVVSQATCPAQPASACCTPSSDQPSKAGML